MDARTYAHVMMVERRILFGVTVFTALGFVLWIVSVSTDYWFIVHASRGTYLNKSKGFFLKSHSGLWRICRTEFKNESNFASSPSVITVCKYHNLFPTQNEIRRNPQIDRTTVHYSRTETAFSIISIILMLMAHGFSIYTFFEPRYMFKRLAGGVHFLAAATVLVVVEVLVNSVNYEATYLPERHPNGATWSYGFSFFLACITFVSLISAGCAFIVCSRKRKDFTKMEELKSSQEAQLQTQLNNMTISNLNFGADLEPNKDRAEQDKDSAVLNKRGIDKTQLQ